MFGIFKSRKEKIKEAMVGTGILKYGDKWEAEQTIRTLEVTLTEVDSGDQVAVDVVKELIKESEVKLKSLEEKYERDYQRNSRVNPGYTDYKLKLVKSQSDYFDNRPLTHDFDGGMLRVFDNGRDAELYENEWITVLELDNSKTGYYYEEAKNKWNLGTHCGQINEKVGKFFLELLKDHDGHSKTIWTEHFEITKIDNGDDFIDSIEYVDVDEDEDDDEGYDDLPANSAQLVLQSMQRQKQACDDAQREYWDKYGDDASEDGLYIYVNAKMEALGYSIVLSKD